MIINNKHNSFKKSLLLEVHFQYNFIRNIKINVFIFYYYYSQLQCLDINYHKRRVPLKFTFKLTKNFVNRL